LLLCREERVALSLFPGGISLFGIDRISVLEWKISEAVKYDVQYSSWRKGGMGLHMAYIPVALTSLKLTWIPAAMSFLPP
jgi:hypothetical protein